MALIYEASIFLTHDLARSKRQLFMVATVLE
jgi:hypothetical protein